MKEISKTQVIKQPAFMDNEGNIYSFKILAIEADIIKIYKEVEKLEKKIIRFNNKTYTLYRAKEEKDVVTIQEYLESQFQLRLNTFNIEYPDWIGFVIYREENEMNPKIEICDGESLILSIDKKIGEIRKDY